MSTGIYDISIILETKCHRILSRLFYQWFHHFFENNFASVLLSLYIKYRFIEIWFCLFVIFHSYGNVTIAGEGL